MVGRALMLRRQGNRRGIRHLEGDRLDRREAVGCREVVFSFDFHLRADEPLAFLRVVGQGEGYRLRQGGGAQELPAGRLIAVGSVDLDGGDSVAPTWSPDTSRTEICWPGQPKSLTPSSFTGAPALVTVAVVSPVR